MLGLGLASPELLEKLLAGFRARLLENIMRVTFHRAERKMHFAGDVLVVFAVDYRAQNILFARGEAVSIAIQRKICGYVALLVACFRNRGASCRRRKSSMVCRTVIVASKMTNIFSEKFRSEIKIGSSVSIIS